MEIRKTDILEVGMSSEQWKSGGDCKLCRRKKYCGKVCKQHREAIRRMVRDVILEHTGGGILGEMLAKSMNRI